MKRHFFNLKKTAFPAIILILICTIVMFCACSCGTSADGYTPYSEQLNKKAENHDLIKEESDIATAKFQTEQKLIRRYSIVAETREYDNAVSAIRSNVDAVGGFISDQNSSGRPYGSSYSYSRYLRVTVRIPAEKVEDFVATVSGLVNVTSVASSVDDVTEAYYDAASRLETLKAERDSLLAMMNSLDNATQFDFWYTLEKRISELESDIASIEQSLRSVDNKVAYSTVSIELREVAELTNVESPSFFDRMGTAFKESWADFADFWQDFTIIIVRLIPALLSIAVITVAIVLIVKLSKKRRKK